jgi:hypothetical protein
MLFLFHGICEKVRKSVVRTLAGFYCAGAKIPLSSMQQASVRAFGDLLHMLLDNRKPASLARLRV